MSATEKAIAAWNRLFDMTGGDPVLFTEGLRGFLRRCDELGTTDATLAAKAIRFRLILTAGRPPARWGGAGSSRKD